MFRSRTSLFIFWLLHSLLIYLYRTIPILGNEIISACLLTSLRRDEQMQLDKIKQNGYIYQWGIPSIAGKINRTCICILLQTYNKMSTLIITCLLIYATMIYCNSLLMTCKIEERLYIVIQWKPFFYTTHLMQSLLLVNQ